MRPARRPPLVGGALLAVPIVAILAWLISGALHRSFDPVAARSAGPREDASLHHPVTGTGEPVVQGLPSPEQDLPPERLFERVNGAADALVAAGCGRLLYWRIDDPPAELEVLLFDRAEGAARTLARDAGTERHPGPGEEASVGGQSIFFRRGRLYARLYGDPDSPAAASALLALAHRVDRALQSARLGSAP